MTVPHFQWFYTIQNLSFSHSCFSRPPRLGDISQCPLKPKAWRNARKRFEYVYICICCLFACASESAQFVATLNIYP
jgi:hypothetical protein